MKFSNIFLLAVTLSIPSMRGLFATQVVMDGSSSVFPISEAIGEEFQKLHRDIKVAVAASGTGGGFKKFCKGEVDITGASRVIEESEIKLCRRNGISFESHPIALDGITVVVHRENTWIDSITTTELRKIWDGGSTINSWKDVRPGFPDIPLKLFGPGHDSGTFDYFTKVINGVEKKSRSNFTASEDDNMIVRGVMGERGSLGYFGFAYYEANKRHLKALAVDAGKGSILPTVESIRSGIYAPLSRPLHIYISSNSLARPEVLALSKFYQVRANEFSEEVGYISFNGK